MNFKLSWLRLFLLITTVCGVFFSSLPAFAAEQVVLKYRVFRESVSVKELTTFADTGKLSTLLRVNLAIAQQDPKNVRRYLTEPVKV